MRNKKKTKEQVIVASLGIFLTIISAFVSGGLISWALYFCSNGLKPPAMVGWLGIFIFCGIYVFIAAGPALILMTIISIIYYSPVKLRLLLNFIITFILSCLTSIVIYLIDGNTFSILCGTALPCLIIVIITETLMHKNFSRIDCDQKQKLFKTNQT